MNTLILLIVFSALIASLNPCTLAVVVMSITSLSGKGKHPRHIGLHTLLFSVGTYLAYAALGLIITLIVTVLPVSIVGYLSIVSAICIVLFGALEIKDYFWYGKGLSLNFTRSAEQSIHTWTKTHHSHLRGFLLGIYTAIRLSHYTTILVVSTTLLVFLIDGTNITIPLVWAFWYIVPLLLMASLSASGVGAHHLLEWREQSKHTMRLAIGLLYVFVGWLLLALLAGGLKVV